MTNAALTISALIVILSWSIVVVPVRRAARLRSADEAAERLRLFKLYAVKKYHPALNGDPELMELSYEEIDERYDLDELYDDLK